MLARIQLAVKCSCFQSNNFVYMQSRKLLEYMSDEEWNETITLDNPG